MRPHDKGLALISDCAKAWNGEAQAHRITSDKLLYSYATELKKQYLKNAPPFGRAAFKKQGDMV